MKKWLAVGLWLTALTVAGWVQEGMAQTTTETNKNIQAALGKPMNSKIDTSNTYVTTSADFEKNMAIDSADITETLKNMVKEIEFFADTLEKFYGKEELSKKVHQILKENPSFPELSENEKRGVIDDYFADFLNTHKDPWGFPKFVWFVLLITAIFYVVSGRSRI